MTQPLFTTKQSIAFVMSPRLGDSLLSMVVVNNLLRNKFLVSVFGDYMYALKAWFPQVTIYPAPKPAEAKEIFSRFDVILHAYHADIIGEADKWHPSVWVFDDFPRYRSRIPMPDIQVEICQHDLLLQNNVRDNNIQPKAGLIWRKNAKRIIIHPTSHELFRNWLPQRFVQLARILQKKGYAPEFIVSPTERKDWLWVRDKGIALPEFATLDAVACHIYESGWFIGNDSGIGHLASNLGIGTLTLGIRPSLLRRWRPSWAAGIVLLPPVWLITRPLKERFWKYFISVNRAAKAFDQLIKEA